MCVICAMRDPNDLLADLDQHLDTPDPTRLSAPGTWDQLALYLTEGHHGGPGEGYKWNLDASRTITYNMTGLSSAEQAIAVAAF